MKSGYTGLYFTVLFCFKILKVGNDYEFSKFTVKKTLVSVTWQNWSHRYHPAQWEYCICSTFLIFCRWIYSIRSGASFSRSARRDRPRSKLNKSEKSSHTPTPLSYKSAIFGFKQMRMRMRTARTTITENLYSHSHSHSSPP